jgi:hypothetical protein
MWKNIVQPDRSQMTIWRIRIACWITKGTNTIIIFNIHCSSTATVVTRTRLNVTLYAHCSIIPYRNASTFFLRSPIVQIGLNRLPTNQATEEGTWMMQSGNGSLVHCDTVKSCMPLSGAPKTTRLPSLRLDFTIWEVTKKVTRTYQMDIRQCDRLTTISLFLVRKCYIIFSIQIRKREVSLCVALKIWSLNKCSITDKAVPPECWLANYQTARCHEPNHTRN